jgi:phage terminase Nu1 subunit (DNA packaging protein)
VLLSINQSAEEFGRDRATITRGVNKLGLVPAGERGGFPVYRLRDLMQIERKDADGVIDPDKLTPFERQAHFRAESERMRLDVERGRLVRAEDVETEWARVLKAIALELDVLPDEIERDVGASPVIIEKVEAKIDLIRERMFARIAAAGTTDAAGTVPPGE